jgi:predicted MFS family arabinose efflux permease
MTVSPDAPDAAPPPPVMTTGLAVLLSTACGLIVANLYYAQPLAGLIGPALGLSPAAAGLIVTLTQLGYGMGLLLIVPLGDLVENRSLILLLSASGIAALLGAALAGSPALFLGASLCIGLSSVSVQILVPYASHLTPEATRGRVVGNIMSGLMLGIMLARPVASLIAHQASWRAVFVLSASILLLVSLVLARALPRRKPASGIGYGHLLLSMARLARTTPVLQRRALYHSALFAAFSLFWTTVPLLLAGPAYHFSQVGIAWFAFAGIAGAIAAPIAGRFADQGWSRAATGLAMLLVAASFLITHLGRPGSTQALGFLVAAGVLLDFGVTTNLVLGQRALFLLSAEYRNRLNGLYMATFFMGGALGSAVGGWAYAHDGWRLASWIGFALPVAALAYYATEFRASRRSTLGAQQARVAAK